MRAAQSEIVKVIATNRKATHDYHIHDRIEAGIQLVGSEVKSLRDARVVIADGFVQFHKGQAFLHNVQIQEYSQANDPVWCRRVIDLPEPRKPGEPLEVTLPIPAEARGAAHVRVFVAGKSEHAAGSANLFIRPLAGNGEPGSAAR